MRIVEVRGWPRWARDTAWMTSSDFGVHRVLSTDEHVDGEADARIVTTDPDAPLNALQKTLLASSSDVDAVLLTHGADPSGVVHTQERVLLTRLPRVPPSLPVVTAQSASTEEDARHEGLPGDERGVEPSDTSSEDADDAVPSPQYVAGRPPLSYDVSEEERREGDDRVSFRRQLVDHPEEDEALAKRLLHTLSSSPSPVSQDAGEEERHVGGSALQDEEEGDDNASMPQWSTIEDGSTVSDGDEPEWLTALAPPPTTPLPQSTHPEGRPRSEEDDPFADVLAGQIEDQGVQEEGGEGGQGEGGGGQGEGGGGGQGEAVASGGAYPQREVEQPTKTTQTSWAWPRTHFVQKNGVETLVAFSLIGVLPPDQLRHLAQQTATLKRATGEDHDAMSNTSGSVTAYFRGSQLRLGSWQVDLDSYDESTYECTAIHDAALAPLRRPGTQQGVVSRMHRQKRRAFERR